ncbi:MAG: nodulation protein NfeD [Armatimonadota bacterium]|nr:nodulation protein NfeD [Armatimonadota bacterium]MDR7449875.1 nodulation protein NfeD [Armatimonadota bacterium]MDR7460550.1 nodulation protein NfeD [Armatimonadota bacterium]MDR7480227.1 nodulation protein NfeD [Armatimonadota bacterium]MDR7488012.1 nodulation protein NfeD [Armatimonadota bacterium]
MPTPRAVLGFALLALALAAVAPLPAGWAAVPAGPPRVLRIDVDGVIAPATARYIARAIRQAEEERAAALLIRLDTPGGLLKSMDDITKVMLNAGVPLIVWVGPEGARAASAGVWVTYAAHIAAMAPATRIGAAHPVGVGQGEQDRTLMEKVTNDAVASLQAIARRRGRNAAWAERAVRQSVSATADEAVRLDVVDLVAPTVDHLLRRVHGRTVETALGPRRLRTADARVVAVGMDVTEEFLSLLSDPNVGFILLNIGIVGVLAELYNPGAILPGVVGGIALILGLASFAILEVNVAGLLLIALAVLLFIADIKVPGHGVLTVGGVVAFIFGAILLTERQAPFLRISLQLIVAVALAMAGFSLFALGAGLRAQRRAPAMVGLEVVGQVGVARSDLAPEGTVHVAGEEWSAVAVDGTIPAGQRVRVVGREGLRLYVEPETRR